MNKAPLVQFSLDARGLGDLRLNRPEKLNAFSQEMMDAFLGALQSAQKSVGEQKLRVLRIVSTCPKAFCVGADLSERLQMSVPEVERTLDKQNEMMKGLAALPIPTIAVIEAAAFGGGLELALACDLRIAQPAAQLGLTETKLAIIPGAGGTQRLTRLIGTSRAKELIFLGRRLSGAEAATIGLVNAVDSNPLRLAGEWSEEILKAGPLAVQAAKRAIEGGVDLGLDEALAWERKCYGLTLHSADRLEGLKSFSEKRSPDYKGK